MTCALVGLITAIGFGVVLFTRFDYVGVAAAIAISGWVGGALLGLILWRRGWLKIDADAKRRLPRICLATITMACVVGYANHLTGPVLTSSSSAAARLTMLAALIALGIAVYFGMLRLLGVVTLTELAALHRKS
jgi:putative peptidoglycan lipid II flippase